MNTRPSAEMPGRQPSRRVAMAALLGAPAVALPQNPALENQPDNPLDNPLGGRAVTLMVPFSPGTTIDLLARLIAEHLRRRFGTVATVENRVGGSGTIASQAVARAQPDGRALLVTTTTFVTTPSLIRGMTYDPLADFAPIANLATGAIALCVHPSLPAASVAEFVTLARMRPGRIDYASAGSGSPQHLAMALFMQAAGIELTHIPYRGSAGALQDLVAGTVPAMVVPVNAALPLRRDGLIRILAVASAARSDIVPDVPTLAEAGFPGMAMDLWYGLLAPARMPQALVDRLNAEMTLMLGDPSMGALLRQQGLLAVPGPPGAFSALLASERDRWSRVIREAGITAE